MCCAGCQGDERHRSHAVEVVSQHQDQMQSDTLRQQQQQQQQQPVPAVHPIGSPQANTPRDNRPVRRSQPEANPDQQTPPSKSDDATGSEDQSQQGDNETDSFTPGAGGKWAGRTRGSAVKESGVGQQIFAEDVQPLHVQEPKSQVPPSQTAAAQGDGRPQLAAATPEAQATGQGHTGQRTARGKRKQRHRAKAKGKGAASETKLQVSVLASKAGGEGLSGAKRKSVEQQDEVAVEAGNGKHAKRAKGSDKQPGQPKGTTQQQPVHGNTAVIPVRGRLVKLQAGHAAPHKGEQALPGGEQQHGQGDGDSGHQQVQAAEHREQGGLAGPRYHEEHSAGIMLNTSSRTTM